MTTHDGKDHARPDGAEEAAFDAARDADSAVQEGAMDTADRIAELENLVEEMRANWQRTQADYQNARRRAQSDVEAGMKRALAPLLDGLLLVLDNLDMALASPADSADAKNLALGVELTRRLLISALANEAVEAIPEGGAFDPEKHQAVSQIPSDEHAPGDVARTLRRGYTWRGGVLRYAQVVVAAPADGDRS